MPIKKCQLNNKPGYKWGDRGKCFTYDPNSKASETKAKNKANDQGIAIGEYYADLVDRLQRINARQKYAELSSQFADADKSTYMQERWISQNDKSTCPVCLFLAGLGWVQLGALPEYEMAHSVLGGPNWSSNSGCRCYKDYQRGTNGTVATFEETKRLWYTTYANLSAQQRKFTSCCCSNKPKEK